MSGRRDAGTAGACWLAFTDADFVRQVWSRDVRWVAQREGIR